MSEKLPLDSLASLNDTPTSTKVSNTSTIAGLDDINYLLHLEILKRFKDDENHLRRQVDEKVVQHQDAKAEYRQMFELYVKLYQESVLRGLLDENVSVPSDHIAKAIADISSVSGKVSNKKRAYLDPDVLKQFTEILHGVKNYDEMEKVQTEMIDRKAVVEDIRSLSEGIPMRLEAATTQSLDYFVEFAKAEHEENLLIGDGD